MITISTFGGDGHMAQAIAEALAPRTDAKLGEHGPDVFLDFSVPEAIEKHVAAAVAARKPLLIGTTGLTPDHHRMIEEAASSIAVIYAANTSLGVNLLVHLVTEAAQRLDNEWDIEIVEMHHRFKVDAPSGTALALGQAAAKGRGVDLDAVSDRGRDGMTGRREPGHIGFAALRGGSVSGEHNVIFAADGERLELGHRAESRAIFARGAVTAALWLIGKPPGRYTMADVLGLK
ncbi:4-hydroxy-tetrahydrodipicolinate reductase [Sphingosinicella rhizophila]|uniref:4-hydroxy-tetrahydrodipicolinate reductase n=1 Tax=Sphingosinicella rhizophila TaxID=3050082 RepID=A0ABU3QAE0_9SPHN|nr:4-hydroxy-tetrahydrodipicolinate reductase [Sphingosinicella sp. GR2756]MDT9600375.1 4-hydroxy-tetrahydrodipicolinate reductase [Sphingosinicella sp. GR2756]